MLLQQHLPFTVLKHRNTLTVWIPYDPWLQQHLPFTVLKHFFFSYCTNIFTSCNSTYRLRYWNGRTLVDRPYIYSCNSTYRLRYWNLDTPISCSSTNLVATDLTVYGIETQTQNERCEENALVATVLTVYGMRRRVWGSRGAVRRWGPHIASTWTKWG